MGLLPPAAKLRKKLVYQLAKQPYIISLLLGNAPPKGKRLALGVGALEDDVDAEAQPSKRAKERKWKQER